MAIIDDVAADDTWFAMKTIAAKSWAADADVPAARFIRRTGGVDVTVVHFVTARFFLFFSNCNWLVSMKKLN